MFLLLTYRTFVFKPHPVLFKPHPVPMAIMSPVTAAASGEASGEMHDDFAELTEPLEAELAEVELAEVELAEAELVP